MYEFGRPTPCDSGVHHLTFALIEFGRAIPHSVILNEVKDLNCAYAPPDESCMRDVRAAKRFDVARQVN